MTGGGNRPGNGAGLPGAPGSKWRNGVGAPANNLGVDGDQYRDTATDDTYSRAGGTYTKTGNLRGGTGPAAPDPTIVAGLTGGSTGCICYLAGAGVVRDLDRSMLGKLRDNVPLFFKHPDGTYRQLNQGAIKGLSGLTAPFAMTLKTRTSSADTNVAYYDINGNGYTTYQPTLFQGYLEPARVLDAATLLANMNLGSVRFADTSGTPVQTVQDKILTTGTYAYTNNAAIPAGVWNYPLGAFSSTYRYGSSDTTVSPSGGVAEFNNQAFTWQAATHVGITAFADGGAQAVMFKGDNNNTPHALLTRQAGTTNATLTGVGVLANFDATVANRKFIVAYFNSNENWVDCTDPASGAQLAPTLAQNVTFRYVVDTIGTFVGAKVWPLSGTEPADYTVWGWQNVVNAAGACGVVGKGGRVSVTDFGVYWAAPGAAPRGP